MENEIRENFVEWRRFFLRHFLLLPRIIFEGEGCI
nr:MAG TPA_asm: hypothetical protein [Caudoviricetes sp.]